MSVLNEVFGGARQFRATLRDALKTYRQQSRKSFSDLDISCGLTGDTGWERLEETPSLITAALFQRISHILGIALDQYVDKKQILERRAVITADRHQFDARVVATQGFDPNEIQYEELKPEERNTFDVGYALLAALEDLEMIDNGELEDELA